MLIVVCILKKLWEIWHKDENSACNTQPQSEKSYWREYQDGGAEDAELTSPKVKVKVT